MRLLVLGGTSFLGRAIATHARAAGHNVTCAARGRSGPPPDGVTFVTVDRDEPNGLSLLGGAGFDALVDVTSRPCHARRAVAVLADRVDHWTGLVTRDLADTARDTLAWVRTVDESERVDGSSGTPWPGLTGEEEAALLAEYRRPAG